MNSSWPQDGRGRDRGGPQSPTGRAPRPRPTGRRDGAGRGAPAPPSPAQARAGGAGLRRLEALNAPSGSARQARGPRPEGFGDCGPAGTEPGLWRCPKLSRSARPAGPPGAGARTGIRRPLVGVSLSLCAWGGRVSPVYFWEPSGRLWASASGLGFEGVMCPSFWRVSVTGRVHSPRVASCAWKEGSHGPQLVGAGVGAGLTPASGGPVV